MVCRIRKFILMAGLGVVLSACSYFDTGAGPQTATGQGQVFDVTNPDVAQPSQPGMTDAGPVSHGAAIPVVPSAPLPSYGEITRTATNGSVEIFPLDDTEPSTLPTAAGSPGMMPLPSSGRGIAANPSVEIFPLDGQMETMIGGRAAPGASALMPMPGGDLAAFPAASTAIIYYAHGSSALNGEDRALIRRVAQQAKTSSTPVRVEGHASVQSELSDPVMRKIANLKISMDRAFKVAEALMKEGVPAEQIETKAYGELRPPRNVPPGRNDNSASRRVEIYGLPESRR